MGAKEPKKPQNDTLTDTAKIGDRRNTAQTQPGITLLIYVKRHIDNGVTYG